MLPMRKVNLTHSAGNCSGRVIASTKSRTKPCLTKRTLPTLNALSGSMATPGFGNNVCKLCVSRAPSDPANLLPNGNLTHALPLYIKRLANQWFPGRNGKTKGTSRVKHTGPKTITTTRAKSSAISNATVASTRELSVKPQLMCSAKLRNCSDTPMAGRRSPYTWVAHSFAYVGLSSGQLWHKLSGCICENRNENLHIVSRSLRPPLHRRYILILRNLVSC